jgi:signal transduction histidine kinase
MPDTSPAPRILVIDDREQTRYVFRRLLTLAGYKVEEATTGSEGLAKSLRQPDLIIADFNLPDMLGFDLTRRLKSNPVTSSIPVLQISANFVSGESRVQALQSGADSYLIQPIDPALLLAQIHAMLRLKKAEAMSMLSGRQWQTTFDSLSDGLAIADSKGIIIRANRAFLNMLELTNSQAEGRPLAEVFESRFSTPLPAPDESLPAGSSAELTFAGNWFRFRHDPIQTETSETGGSVLLLTPFTEVKKLQETLKMNERLAATGRLAHIIAHEINNPLEAMSNLLFLAQNDPSITNAGRSYLDQSNRELERISQITKQILAYHRESKHPLAARADELLEDVLAMFRAHMISHRVNIATRVATTELVNVHPGEIRQAFGNLVANALDAIGNHGGQLRVHCLPAFDSKSRSRGVRFLFSDSGPGIPTDVSPHIFDAFYSTKDLKGSGIGLWLTSEIVAKHNGRMRVRSRTDGPYRGTLFDVFLPAYVPASDQTTSQTAFAAAD